MYVPCSEISTNVISLIIFSTRTMKVTSYTTINVTIAHRSRRRRDKNIQINSAKIKAQSVY